MISDEEGGGKAGGGLGRGWGYKSTVYVCVNCPQSSQIVLNSLCRGQEICLGGGRSKGKITGLSASASTTTTTTTTNMTMTVPLFSIKTAGVFCRAFCNFRPKFEVANEDWQVPRETSLDRVKVETMGRGGDRDRNGEGEGEGEGAAAPMVMRCLEGGDTVRFLGGYC